MRILKRGYTMSISLAAVCMLVLCRWLLHVQLTTPALDRRLQNAAWC
jgi:hypothetical protein